jgi:hypothetical protein
VSRFIDFRLIAQGVRVLRLMSLHTAAINWFLRVLWKSYRPVRLGGGFFIDAAIR